MPRGHTCPRKGCKRSVSRRREICWSCWTEVPPATRAEIARLGQEKRYGARDELRADALRKLGRKRIGAAIAAGASAISVAASVQAYARINAMMGEHDELEAV